MSERGKFLWADTISNWSDDDLAGKLPILAGKIGESYNAGELVFFEFEILPLIEINICHPVRIVILCDSGDTGIFKCMPKGGESDFIIIDQNLEPIRDAALNCQKLD